MIDNRLAPYGAFALRVALGIMFIAHAYLKLAVFTVPGFEAFLGQAGLPAFLAWPIIVAELVGGLAILVGFHARFFALALLPCSAPSWCMPRTAGFSIPPTAAGNTRRSSQLQPWRRH